MTLLLPLVALALAFAAPFLSRAERGRLEPLRAGALVLLLVVAAVVVQRSAPEADRTPALVGLVLGALACVLGQWGGGLGFGVAAAGALHLLPSTSLPTAGLALVAGTGLGALAVGGELSALAAVLVAAADNLGMRHSQVPAFAFVGSQAGVALAVGGFLATFLPKKYALARPVPSGIVLVGVGAYIASTLKDGGIANCIEAGAVSGVVLHLLMPNEEGDSPRVGLAAVIGVALATVAFGLGKGVGMALAALGAVGVLLSVENRRAVLALGPLAGLVLYRVLHDAGTGATRSLDIAQNYTLLALVLGLTLPLLPMDWRRERTGAPGALLWGIGAVAAPPLVVIALGMRGGVGFVAGLGVAGLVQALRVSVGEPGILGRGSESTAGDPLLPLALGAGLAGGTILALGWLGEESAISRDQKLHLFGYAAAGAVVLAVLLALAGRQKGQAS